MDDSSEDYSFLSSTTTTEFADQLECLTNGEIFNRLLALRQKIEFLEVETIMFKEFYEHLDPSEVASLGDGTGGRRFDRSVSRKRAKSRSSNADRVSRLTLEQKCQIANRNIKQLEKKMEKNRKERKKTLETLKAIEEEADVRYYGTKKTWYEFERDVVKKFVNPRTNLVRAEKCVQYFEDMLKASDALIAKLKVKNATLRVQKKKMSVALRQKEELAAFLQEVDFDQMKIENQNYVETIEERNQDIHRLKHMHSYTVKVLNSYKHKLSVLTKTANQLDREIKLREDMEARVKTETRAAEQELIQAEAINKKLRHQLTLFKVPDVMDYVNEKMEVRKLQKQVQYMQRKTYLAEISLYTRRKTLGCLQRSMSRRNQLLHRGSKFYTIRK